MTKLQGGSYVFVSYAHADADYVLKLTAFLAAQGIPFWFDEDRLNPGSKFSRKIRDAIDACSGFVLVMTPASEDSGFVEEERDRAESRDKALVPLLVEGEKHFGVARRNFIDLRNDDDGEPPSMPPESVVDYLRALTQPPTAVAPSMTMTAPPGPSVAIAVGTDGALANLVVDAGDVRIIRTDDPVNQRVVRLDAPTVRLTISPDGSLVALQSDGGVRLAEVTWDGELSLWDLELQPDDLGAGPTDPAPSVLALGRSRSRLDPSAELLVNVGAATYRIHVDRRGRRRRLPATPGESFQDAVALTDGFLLLRSDGGFVPVGRALENAFAGGNWVAVDAADGQRAGGAADDVITLIAALRVVDGDTQLIACRIDAHGDTAFRGVDLEFDAQRLSVVRTRTGGAPDRVLVTAGDRQRGWLWSEMVPLDLAQLIDTGIP